MKFVKNKMFKIFKVVWRFLAEVGGVIATIIILTSLFNFAFIKIVEFFKAHLFLGILFILASIISIVFLALLARNRILKAYNLFRKEISKEKISNLEQIDMGKAFDLDKILPTEKLFKDILQILRREALSWAQDSKLESLSFYLEANNKIEITTQVTFVSHWKNEQLTLYFPGLSEQIHDINKYRTKSRTPFFEVDRWREAILKSYEKVSSKTGNKLELIINSSSGNNEFNFTICYYEGRKWHESEFEFKDGVLIVLDNGSKVSLSD